MLQLLAHGDSSVGELGAPFRMSFAGAAKQQHAFANLGTQRLGLLGVLEKLDDLL